MYKYLKDTYLLQGVGISKITVDELHKDYIAYCIDSQVKYKGKIDFNTSLKNIGIIFHKCDKINYYNCDYATLKSIADKFKWVHDLDVDMTSIKVDQIAPVDDLSMFVKVVRQKNKAVIEPIIEQIVEPVIVVEKKPKKKLTKSIKKEINNILSVLDN